MAYFNTNEKDYEYPEKGNSSKPNNLLKSIRRVILLFIIVGWWFFGSYETMSCGQNSCELYKTRYFTKVSYPYEKFYESDIERFGFTDTRHYNNNEHDDYETIYIPYVILKDGSIIRLKPLKTKRLSEAKYLNFNSLRNKKF